MATSSGSARHRKTTNFEVQRTTCSRLWQFLDQALHDLTWNFEPLKSASIAQVHLDKTWEGQAAVAKVQHPHVRDQYLADLETMKYLGEYVSHHDEAKGAAVMLGALAEKLRPTVVAETDFTKEAVNQRKLQESLRGIAIVPEACLSMVLF